MTELTVKLYNDSRRQSFLEIEEMEDLEEEEKEYLRKFLEDNETDILPEIVKKEELGCSWKLVFTHNTCSQPTDYGFTTLTPRQLSVWKTVFLLEEDITEYKAALRLVGSWDNWEFMKETNSYFKNQVELWKRELDIKRRSASEEKISEMAAEGSFNANKYICTREPFGMNITPGQTSDQIINDVNRLKDIGLLV